jgi:hypothetical protein
MHVDRHLANGERPAGTGTSTPSQSTDALSGLNIGSTSVSGFVEKMVVNV